MRYFLRPLIFFVAIPQLLLLGCTAEEEPDPQRAQNPCQVFDEENPLSPNSTLDDGCFELRGLHTLTSGELHIGPRATLYLSEYSTLEIQDRLFISPGARLLFEKDAGLNINGGTIIAEGTPEEPIIFRGTHEVAGHWQGLRVTNSSQPSTLANVHLRHAASQRWHDRQGWSRANLLLDQGALMNLNNVRIGDSGHMGLAIHEGTLLSCQGVSFFNIGLHHIYPPALKDLCP